MLADTESEKSKWVVALSELHRILKRNNLPNTMVRNRLFKSASTSARYHMLCVRYDANIFAVNAAD